MSISFPLFPLGSKERKAENDKRRYHESVRHSFNRGTCPCCYHKRDNQ